MSKQTFYCMVCLKKLIRESKIILVREEEKKVISPNECILPTPEMKIIFKNESDFLLPERYLNNENWTIIFMVIKGLIDVDLPKKLIFEDHRQSAKMKEFFFQVYESVLKITEEEERERMLKYLVKTIEDGVLNIKDNDLKDILNKKLFLSKIKDEGKKELYKLNEIAAKNDEVYVKGFYLVYNNSFTQEFEEKTKRLKLLISPPPIEYIFEKFKNFTKEVNSKKFCFSQNNDFGEIKTLKETVKIFYNYFNENLAKKEINCMKLNLYKEGQSKSIEFVVLEEMIKMECIFINDDVGFVLENSYLDGGNFKPQKGIMKVCQDLSEEFRFLFVSLGVKKNIKKQKYHNNVDNFILNDDSQENDDIQIPILEKKLSSKYKKKVYQISENGSIAWLNSADEHLKSAEVLYIANCFNQSCFMSRQSTENSLKGAALNIGELTEEDTRTHQIRPLMKKIKCKENVEIMEEIYISSRFPKKKTWSVKQYSKEDAEKSLEISKRIYKFCSDLIFKKNEFFSL